MSKTELWMKFDIFHGISDALIPKDIRSPQEVTFGSHVEVGLLLRISRSEYYLH